MVVRGFALRIGMRVRMSVRVRVFVRVPSPSQRGAFGDRRSRLRRERGDHGTSVLDTLGGDDPVARHPQLCGRTAHHDDFEAMIVIEMNVQRRDDCLAEFVLHLGELLGQLAHVMVVDNGERRRADAAFGYVLLGEIRADQIAQRLGAIRVAAALDAAIEALEQVTVHRDAEADQFTGGHGPGETIAKRRAYLADPPWRIALRHPESSQPRGTPRRHLAGKRLRVWDRVDDDLVERVIEGDTTRCNALGLYWVVRAIEEAPSALRLAEDPEGRVLVPDRVEREREARARAREQEAAARRIAELEAELRRRQGEQTPRQALKSVQREPRRCCPS